jgi:hypothetical protein
MYFLLGGGEKVENHHIQKFDINGNFTTKWGRKDNSDGELPRLEAIVVSSRVGSAYPTNTGNLRVQIFGTIK